MKYITVIIILFMTSLSIQAQCVANAGFDIHRCRSDSSVQLGGNPTAFGGVPPYTYTWSIDPISTSSQSIPFIYASDILDDTTGTNPNLIYLGGFFIGDSLLFYLKVTDSIGCWSFDTLLLTTSQFNKHVLYFDYYINEGDSIYLNNTPNISGGFGTIIYDWEPSYGLSDTNLSAGFWAYPHTSTAYTATVTDSKNCTVTAQGPTYYIWVNPSGMDNEDKILIKSYPNPTDGIVNIDLENHKPIQNIECYAASGEKILTKLSSQNHLDLSSYPSGVYFLKLYFEGKISILRIVKE